jgi:serine/threonine-protein kinase
VNGIEEDSAVLNVRATVRMLSGAPEDAVALRRKAIQLDPTFVIWRANLAGTLIDLGEYDEAESILRKALELQPAARSIHRNLSLLAFLRGQGDVALREAQLEPEGIFHAVSLALAENARGDRVQADAALENFIARYGENFPLEVALVYGGRGEADEVFEWLNRAYAARQPGFLAYIGHPLFKGFHSDQRFVELCRKTNVPVPK